MGWWIALAVLVGLAVLPLGVRLQYDAKGAYVAVLVGPVRIQLFPERKKPVKHKKKTKAKPKAETVPEAPEAQPAPTPEPAPVPTEKPLEEKYPNLEKKPQISKQPPAPGKTPKSEESGGDWKDFLVFVPIVLDFLGSFWRKLRVNRLELHLVLAGGDPCDLAVNYGRAWAAVGNFMPHLERILVIKKRDIRVECDFTGSKTAVTAGMDLTITLGRLLAVTVIFALRALKEYLNMKKTRKGGAVT